MKLSKAEVICYLVAVIGFFSAHVMWHAPFWIFFLAVGCASVLAYLVDRNLEQTRPSTVRPREKYVSPYRVEFNDHEVSVLLEGEEQKHVAWSDLIYVGIRIENEGFIDMPYWLFGGAKGSCFFPSDAVGSEKIIDEMERRLQNINYRAIAEAMGSVSGGWTVWERPESNSPGTAVDADNHGPYST